MQSGGIKLAPDSRSLLGMDNDIEKMLSNIGGCLKTGGDERKAWKEIVRLARLGAAVERLPELFKPDYPDESPPDYVQVGVNDRGDWSIQRWIRTEPFDEDGPIGEGRTAAAALQDALEHV
jgi:hypothetical protein